MVIISQSIISYVINVNKKNIVIIITFAKVQIICIFCKMKTYTLI